MKKMLLLHGALGAQSQLKELKEALEKEGFSVLTMDFSGHGSQPFSADFGIHRFSEDVLAQLDAKGIASTSIFGYSMGGYVAIYFAHRFPDRVEKIITLGTKFDWSEASAAHETRKMNPDLVVQKVPAFARILESRHKKVEWKALMEKTAEMMRALGANPLLTPEILSTITARTLILLGDGDDMADRKYSESVATMIPDARFEMLENTPHPIEKVDIPSLSRIVSAYVPD